MATRSVIGSISSGTMNPDDLIPTFMECLQTLDPARYDKMLAEWSDNNDEYCSAADELDMLDSLFDVLGKYALPYFYFGSHPGDGADYGFWLPEGFPDDFDGLKVSDTSEVPEDYSGEVLHVNDHGNCTLYSAENGQLTEVWSVV